MKSMFKVGVLSAFAVALLSVTSAFAQDAAKKKSKHEGPPPAAGEVVSIDKAAITIKDHKGGEHKFKITEKTKYGTEKAPQKFEDLEKGDHVLITASGEGDAAEALVIRELPAHGHGHVDDLKKSDADKKPAAEAAK